MCFSLDASVRTYHSITPKQRNKNHIPPCIQQIHPVEKSHLAELRLSTNDEAGVKINIYQPLIRLLYDFHWLCFRLPIFSPSLSLFLLSNSIFAPSVGSCHFWFGLDALSYTPNNTTTTYTFHTQGATVDRIHPLAYDLEAWTQFRGRNFECSSFVCSCIYCNTLSQYIAWRSKLYMNNIMCTYIVPVEKQKE